MSYTSSGDYPAHHQGSVSVWLGGLPISLRCVVLGATLAVGSTVDPPLTR